MNGYMFKTHKVSVVCVERVKGKRGKNSFCRTCRKRNSMGFDLCSNDCLVSYIQKQESRGRGHKIWIHEDTFTAIADSNLWRTARAAVPAHVH